MYCKQCREIDRVQRQLPQIRLLKGAEVDILDDGTLDLDDATLQEFDLVVISVHSKLTMDRTAMTGASAVPYGIRSASQSRSAR